VVSEVDKSGISRRVVRRSTHRDSLQNQGEIGHSHDAGPIGIKCGEELDELPTPNTAELEKSLNELYKR